MKQTSRSWVQGSVPPRRLTDEAAFHLALVLGEITSIWDFGDKQVAFGFWLFFWGAHVKKKTEPQHKLVFIYGAQKRQFKHQTLFAMQTETQHVA